MEDNGRNIIHVILQEKDRNGPELTQVDRNRQKMTELDRHRQVEFFSPSLVQLAKLSQV